MARAHRAGCVLTLQENLARLDAGHAVRIPVSTTKVIALLVLGIAVGLPMLLLVVYITVHAARTGDVIAAVNPRTAALVVAVVGCLLLLPIAVAVRLSRKEELVLTREGLTEVQRGTPVATTRWSEMGRVEIVRTHGRITRLSPRMVTYTLAPRGRDRLQHERAAAGLRPARWLAAPEPRVTMRQQYSLSPRRLGELLAAAHQRYGRTPSPPGGPWASPR